MIRKILIILILCCCGCSEVAREPAALVFQSDFGLKDGAVSAMKGVAHGVSPRLKLYDITHEIPAYNIWEAAYRLQQTAPYWPEGTVFVSVVDPGVGTDRRSVVLQTESGHYFVTPDNGTLTLVAESMGIKAVRQIDEAINRRAQSEKSYTFHGRDVYAYTGARLAAGVIAFEAVGQLLPKAVLRINYQKAAFFENQLRGAIPILDVQYGNVWTNIDRELFAELDAQPGDSLLVKIFQKRRMAFSGELPLARTFGDVPENSPLLYFNSLDRLSIALNMASFAEKHGIQSGPEWRITINRAAGKGNENEQ